MVIITVVGKIKGQTRIAVKDRGKGMVSLTLVSFQLDIVGEIHFT